MRFPKKKFCMNSVCGGLMVFYIVFWNYLYHDKKAHETHSDVPFIKQSQDTDVFVNYYREYTYDDPTSYDGPILESWAPLKSRSVKQYINYAFTHYPGSKNFFNKTLLVMVQSSPSERDHRDNWRTATMRQLHKNVAVIFILGQDNDFGDEQEQKLLEEMHMYQDIVQINGLIEHYDNLTLKSLYSLKFFLTNDMFPSRELPKYMLKVDMDVFVNIPKLIHLLTEDEEVMQEEYLLMGQCLCCGGESNSHCLRQDLGNSKETNLIRKNWKIPSYLYNGKKYPSYIQGAGYLLSRSSVSCIYRKALETPYFPMEDVYITGFVAQECGIKRQDDPHFTDFWKFPVYNWKSMLPKKDFALDRLIVYHLDCGLKTFFKTEVQKNKCHNLIRFIADTHLT